MPLAKCFIAALYASRAGAALLKNEASKWREAAPSIPHFDSFIEKFGRSYAKESEEYRSRRSLYDDRAAAARQQNAQEGRLWTAGVNYLWDWTEDEFSRLRGWRGSARPAWDSQGGPGLVQLQGGDSPTPLPEEHSWANLAAQRRIRNQGGCGSCWAIAGETVLQAHTEIHTGVVRTFSAQQLVSCVENPHECGGGGGCKGATVELAYTYVMKHGLSDENQVPYAADDGICSNGNSNATVMPILSQQNGVVKSPTMSGATAFGMRGWEKLPENQYEPLIRALVERGPVAISTAASPWGLYEAGIFNGCPRDVVIDHAVVLIGYGKETISKVTTKYWTIQNSWSDTWGENGKIRLLRQEDHDTYCGTNDHPEMGTGCKGGPKEVTVCGMCGIMYDSVIPHF